MDDLRPHSSEVILPGYWPVQWHWGLRSVISDLVALEGRGGGQGKGVLTMSDSLFHVVNGSVAPTWHQLQ